MRPKLLGENLLLVATMLAPLASFAAPGGGGNPNAPEIDGGLAILGIALVAGVLSLLKKGPRK